MYQKVFSVSLNPAYYVCGYYIRIFLDVCIKFKFSDIHFITCTYLYCVTILLFVVTMETSL